MCAACVGFAELCIDFVEFWDCSGDGVATIDGDAAAIDAEIGDVVFVPTTLTSIDGISMLGDVTAVITLEAAAAGSGNV